MIQQAVWTVIFLLVFNMIITGGILTNTANLKFPNTNVLFASMFAPNNNNNSPQNNTRIIASSSAYIAVVVDPLFVNVINSSLSVSSSAALTNESAYSIFYQAVSQENRRRTSIGINNAKNFEVVEQNRANPNNNEMNSAMKKHQQYQHRHQDQDDPTTPPPPLINIRPIFVNSRPNLTVLEMATEIDDAILSSGGGHLAAVLEISTCSPEQCHRLNELSAILPRQVITVSACCFTHNNNQEQDDSIRASAAPKFVYNSLEPHSLVHLVYLFANAYHWRRFHFVVSPNWPTYDAFAKELTEAFAKEAADAAGQHRQSSSLFGDIIVTQSYFCTRYLAEGNLCSPNQARHILLTQATAIFMLLDGENDMPEFIRQINGIARDDSSRLLAGKAIFLVHLTGVLSHIFEQLFDHAPDGLMIVRQKRTLFNDYHPATIRGVEAVGPDALLYAELRVLARAVEIFEQNPGSYDRPSEFYCGTTIKFNDSEDSLSYSEHCDFDEDTLEIFNVQKHQNNNNNINNNNDNDSSLSYSSLIVPAFITESGHLYRYSWDIEPHWFGSRKIAPVEDFCKLEGSGCPISGADYIVSPAIVGIVVLTCLIALVTFVINRRTVANKRQLDEKRARVVIKYDDLHFEMGLTTTTTTAADPTIPQHHINNNETLQVLSQMMMSNKMKTKTNNTHPAAAGGVTITALAGRLAPLGPAEGVFASMTTRKRPVYKAKAPTGKALVKATLYGEEVFIRRLVRQKVSLDKQLLEELLPIHGLSHPNINVLFGVTLEQNRVCSVQQWCQKGTLAGLLARDRLKLEPVFKISFVTDIANGMKYLHQSRIKSHGRLKPENILVDARWMCKISNIPIPTLYKPDERESLRGLEGLKLIRTGSAAISPFPSPKLSGNKLMARFGGDGNGGGRSPGRLSPSKSASPTASPALGRHHAIDAIPFDEEKDFYYTAPELLRVARTKRPLRGTQSGDIYAFAYVIYEILTRQKPFAASQLPARVICEKLRKPNKAAPDYRPTVKGEIEDNVEELFQIAKACWDEHPDNRPGFVEICQVMKLINDGKENSLIDQMVLILEKRAEDLEGVLEAREEELDGERAKTQQLMAKLVPKFVIDEMMNTNTNTIENRSMPQRFESATIFVSDIVDFNQLVLTSPPGEIVAMLDELCAEFDAIIDGANADGIIYKAEQNGAALKIVGGLVVGDDRDENINGASAEIATMALEMMAFVNTFQMANRSEAEKLQFRCGIHTGPVVLGGGGKVMPPRCYLFGESFDVAAEMLRTNVALRIQISGETKAELDRTAQDRGSFKVLERFGVEVQGRGKTSTFFLTGKKGFKKHLPDWMPRRKSSSSSSSKNKAASSSGRISINKRNNTSPSPRYSAGAGDMVVPTVSINDTPVTSEEP